MANSSHLSPPKVQITNIVFTVIPSLPSLPLASKLMPIFILGSTASQFCCLAPPTNSGGSTAKKRKARELLGKHSPSCQWEITTGTTALLKLLALLFTALTGAINVYQPQVWNTSLWIAKTKKKKKPTWLSNDMFGRDLGSSTAQKYVAYTGKQERITSWENCAPFPGTAEHRSYLNTAEIVKSRAIVLLQWKKQSVKWQKSLGATPGLAPQEAKSLSLHWQKLGATMVDVQIWEGEGSNQFKVMTTSKMQKRKEIICCFQMVGPNQCMFIHSSAGALIHAHLHRVPASMDFFCHYTAGEAPGHAFVCEHGTHSHSARSIHRHSRAVDLFFFLNKGLLHTIGTSRN